MNFPKFGDYLAKDPTLKDLQPKDREGIPLDFYGHINSHDFPLRDREVSGPCGGDPAHILKTCRFCQINHAPLHEHPAACNCRRCHQTHLLYRLVESFSHDPAYVCCAQEVALQEAREHKGAA